MFVKVGNYPHPINECNLRRMEIRHRFSPRRKRITKVISLYLEGYLYADTQSGLTTAIGNLINAYSEDYQEIGLYEDDGAGNLGQRTPHYIDNVNSISGVKILGRNWPKGEGDEYANKRFFSISAYSEYLDVESQLVYWRDAIKIKGTGGPRREVHQGFFGPYEFLSALATPQHIIRSGEAIGFQGYVSFPGPIGQGIEDEHLRELELGSGEQQGLLPCFFPSHWTYYHTALTPIGGVIPWTR